MPKDMNTADMEGWLAPDGTFFPSAWGEHGVAALDIIDENGYYPPFREWRKAQDSVWADGREYLVSMRHYCLIHDPGLTGERIVSGKVPISKAQEDFLLAHGLTCNDIVSHL